MSVQKFQISDVQQRARDLTAQIAVNVMNHIDVMYPQLWEKLPGSARRSINNTIRNQAHLIAEAMRTGQ